MELSSQMILFAQVVDAGSFSAAARKLDHTPSAISRQIAVLEDQLAIRLLNRTGRGISMTGEGKRFYESCKTVAQEVNAARTMLTTMTDHPSGRLSIVSTTAFGKSQVLPILTRFTDLYPEVTISLKLTDQVIDISNDSVDVAIRFSEQILDQSVMSRKLAKNTRVLVASPEYVRKMGYPASIPDLKNHNCLRLSTISEWNDWIPANTSSTFDCNSADAIYHAARSGLGVARLSTYLVHSDLNSGELVRILPDYQQNESQIVLIFADKRNLSPKLRAFIDFMVDAFSPAPPWELPDPSKTILAGE